MTLGNSLTFRSCSSERLANIAPATTTTPPAARMSVVRRTCLATRVPPAGREHLPQQPDLALVVGLVVQAVQDAVAERAVLGRVDDLLELLRRERWDRRREARELLAQRDDHVR